jgi:hypothetical protein
MGALLVTIEPHLRVGERLSPRQRASITDTLPIGGLTNFYW